MLPIKQLSLYNSDKEMISIYDDYLFHWDIMNAESQQRPQPISITIVGGIRNFDVLPHNNTTLSICGKFGISLFDTRDSKFIKWNPDNDNVLAVGHGDGVVRLWDVRKQDYFSSLRGHSRRSTLNQVTSIEWDQGDLFTGGQDGNIIHWDLTSDVSLDDVGHMNCGLREGLDSVKFNEKTNSVEVDVNQRQCGTVLPASNTNVVAMCSVANDCNEIKIMSIDGSSFLGVHSQVKEAIKLNINPEKLYYSEEDIQELLRYERSINSKDDLSSCDQESLIEPESPLTIRRKPLSWQRPALDQSEAERGNQRQHDTEAERRQHRGRTLPGETPTSPLPQSSNNSVTSGNVTVNATGANTPVNPAAAVSMAASGATTSGLGEYPSDGSNVSQMKVDPIFVDHNTRTTTWVDPRRQQYIVHLEQTLLYNKPVSQLGPLPSVGR
ncbi:unnamed protein product [Candida parapsilosis]